MAACAWSSIAVAQAQSTGVPVAPQAAGQRASGVAAPAAPQHAKLQGLLAAGNFAQLDAELAAYQEAYRAGAINDEAASKAFIALDRSDPDLRAQYDKWVAEKPGSYVARVARGFYLMRLGFHARGSASAAQTSKAQFDAMRAYFKDAMEDLSTSLKLDAKPVLGYGTMIAIADGVGARELAAKFADAAIALDPRVYTARASYLASLRPEWGGSLELMQAALNAWKGSVDETQHRRLQSIYDDSLWRAKLEPAAQLVKAKQCDKAIPIYDEALKQGPVLRAYSMRGYCLAELGQHEKAIEDYNRVLEIEPDGGCCSGTRSSRARSYLKLGQKDKALEDLTTAAEYDDEWAARELAVIYAFGRHGFKPDYTAARRWCERAAKQGDGLAMYCVGSLYHAGLGVPRDAALAAKWFKPAAERGIADAQADFAFMLWTGQGAGQDHDQAIKWWRAAAKQGNKRSQTQLDNNLSSWEYFRKVSVPDWANSTRESRPMFHLALLYIGLADE